MHQINTRNHTERSVLTLLRGLGSEMGEGRLAGARRSPQDRRQRPGVIHG